MLELQLDSILYELSCKSGRGSLVQMEKLIFSLSRLFGLFGLFRIDFAEYQLERIQKSVKQKGKRNAKANKQKQKNLLKEIKWK